MRRLPGILLLTVATLIVIVALLISGLRLLLPHLDSWRPQLVERLQAATGRPVDIGQIQADWKNFGPTLDVRDVQVGLQQGGSISIKRVTLALNVWKSLLHLRWQFRDLTFYQLRMLTNTPFSQNRDQNTLESDRISDLFLRQLDHFDLRDSSISFLTLSGQRAEMTIPQLSWLNSRNRHRAEGQVSLSSFNGQQGIANVRMDLRDENGLLDRGKVWLQADNVNVKPWLGRWMKDNIDLQTAQFSLAAWMELKAGEIAGANIWLKQGGGSWKEKQLTHTLSVDNLMARIDRFEQGWRIAIPSTNITLDEQKWPHGSLAIAWTGLPDEQQQASNRHDELRIRATNMVLQNFSGLLPLAQKISPDLVEAWRNLQPQGDIEVMALDIPLQQLEKTRMQGRWKNVSWRPWQQLPGIEHFSGSVAGSIENGRLNAQLKDISFRDEKIFGTPVDINSGIATLEWQKNDTGFQLDGKDIDLKGRSVWGRGDFRYLQPKVGDPWLGILSGINIGDIADARHYFPENLMGKKLVHYLSGALLGGEVKNATLVYGGDPNLFPYPQNQGQFEVMVPLRHAKFAFQPDWPAIENLNIDLDFVNNGLWMKADEVKLGEVTGRNLIAAIPDYNQEKLLIDTQVSGPGAAVGKYFNTTPLADSLGSTLDELQIGGNVSANLHLDIPLDDKDTVASGSVVLNNNTLLIKPLNSTLSNLSGKFQFVNGDLHSELLQANWFNQPVNVDFATKTDKQAYQVKVNLNGNWQPVKTGLLPDKINQSISGTVPWKSEVAIHLPDRGRPTYKVNLTGNLKNVSSHLPAPANKPAGLPLPFKLAATGDLDGFTLTGNIGSDGAFASRWGINKKLTLEKAIFNTNSGAVPVLPGQSQLEINLPAIDATQWIALLNQGLVSGSSPLSLLPARMIVRTPVLNFAGQHWNNLSLVSLTLADGLQIQAQGREINAVLAMRKNLPWQAMITYLYFNPSNVSADKNSADALLPDSQSVNFHNWPDLQLRCVECWLWGQKYGRIEGDLAVKGNALTLDNGLVENGAVRLSGSGEWVNNPQGIRTSVKGKLKGKNLDQALSLFDVKTPIQDASFTVDYDLHWRNAPWKPELSSLNGVVHTRLGKGQITDLGTGHAGQLLRLVSFDALLRKLRFDFSDTFGRGFYFDSIRSTAWIKEGVLHTEDTLVDGLEADIGMSGSVDLVRHNLNIEATVAPEISATVGVATAFVINPIAGAAVFAASRVLGPLWSKISLLRYHLSGTMDKPEINEVLRRPREKDAK